MDGIDGGVEMEAITWTIRLRDADADVWQRFTAWLAEDARHAMAYDRVSLLGDGLARSQPRAGAAVVLPRRSSRLRLYLPIGAAAALMAVVGSTLLLRRSAETVTYATPIGMQRTLAIGDDTRITLAGGTRLTMTRGDARSANLVAGTARFHVMHDATHPFEVRLGDDHVRDVGTDFALTRADRGSEVAVIDGAVLYNPDRERLQLAAGDRIVDPDGPGEIVRSRVDPRSVAQWAAGSLAFDDATLVDVARELARATGLSVTTDPALAGRRFTGRIVLGDGTRVLAHRVGALLAVDVRPAEGGWRLVPGGRAAR